MRIVPCALVAIGLCLGLTANRARAAGPADWPHFRGLTRDGIATSVASGWNGKEWPGAQPVWSAEVGRGGSSPLIAGGLVFTLGWNDGREILRAIDLETGKLRWEQSYPAPEYGRHATGDEGLYNGPSATPEVDVERGRLFTLGADGDLRCWNIERGGELVWKQNLYDTYGVGQRPKVGRAGRRDYGYTTTPFLFKDQLFVQVGDDSGNVMAFAAATGDEVWKSAHQGFAGHTGALVPMRLPAREGGPIDGLAGMTIDGLLIVEISGPQPGRTAAYYPWTTDFANNVASPVVVDERRIVITSGYNRSAIVCLEFSPESDDPRQRLTKAWEQSVYSLVCTPVVHRGQIYFAWNKLHCLDAATGRLHWSGGDFGDAASCIMTSDERLIVWGGRGKLALVESFGRSPAACTILAERSKLARDDVWPHAAASAGRLVLRDRQGKLICFTLGK